MTTLGLFVGAAVGERIADHAGRERTLCASLLLFGLCSLLTAITGGAESLFVARLLTGLGVASFLVPKVTVGFPGNYRASCEFPPLKQDVSTWG